MSFHANNHRSGEHASAQQEARNKTDDQQSVGSTCCGVSGLRSKSFKLHLANCRLLGHPKFVFAPQLRLKGLKGDL
ncbi:hypothetical protein J7I98_35590 [Streptomyces sp. ISL-98]|uniref:hypothetical protein n=1 Tax=Streptomyces sp. ISL-98 TaxID=2819192 RepID=UPI001BEB7629|nr:hypothetical protein [Streptomyces sp. ISL-98]MBT2511055.1 hypothetical protein [Streptomyces sp. ISL-98]